MKRIASIFLLGSVLWAADAKIPTYTGTGNSRTIHYGKDDVVEVKTHLRWTTEIVLPQSEKILDFIAGDKDNWVITGEADVNFVTVKPKAPGMATNLILITSSGNHYRFVLHESDDAPDMAITVDPSDETMQKAAAGPPKYVSAQEVVRYQKIADSAQTELEDFKVKTEAERQLEQDKYRAQYPKTVDDQYKFDRGARPFNLQTVFNDGKFTYIKAKPEEVASVYETKDGKPSMIEARYADGMYIIPKIVRNGYLAAGKKRTSFDYVGN